MHQVPYTIATQQNESKTLRRGSFLGQLVHLDVVTQRLPAVLLRRDIFVGNSREGWAALWSSRPLPVRSVIGGVNIFRRWCLDRACFCPAK